MTAQHNSHDVLDELSHLHLPERRIWKFRIKDSHTKIAIIALILLTFITVAELSYQVSRKNALLSKLQAPIVQIETSPRPITEPSSSETKIQTNKLDMLAQTFDSLNEKPTLITDARALVSTKGTLINLTKFIEGSYEASLTIKDGNNQATYYLTQQEVDNLIVVFTKQQRRAGSFNDLLQGEQITLTENTNFLESSNNNNYIIEVDR